MSEVQSEQSTERKKLFQMHSDLSRLMIPAGKLVFGKTYTRIVVSGEGAPTMIEIAEGQGALSGLRFTGTAKPGPVDARIAIDVQRLLLRSGRVVPVQGNALDPEGSLGLPAEVISGKTLAVIGAMGSSLIAGVAASQQTVNTNAFGFSQPEQTGRNAVLQGVAQTAADQSKRLIDEATAEKPILILDQGAPVVVMIQEEVKF